MKKLYVEIVLAVLFLTGMAAAVAAQRAADLRAMAVLAVNVPMITGLQSITVPVQVLLPVGEDNLLVNLDVVLRLNLTDTLAAPVLGATPLIVVFPTHTLTRTPAPTVRPTNTPTPVASLPSANGTANLRSGPNTTFDVVGSVQTGQLLDIVGRNVEGTWLLLKSGAWIAAFLVDNSPDVNVAATIPPTPLPSIAAATPTSPPPAFIQPAPAPAAQPPAQAVCSCTGNIYNCPAFATHAAAQACFNYCISLGVGDIHRLDGDNDGDACESLP